MKGVVKVLNPGFFSTIQDNGRLGFRKYGVPCSGAMDQFSFKRANLLLGNDMNNDAVIEWMIKPPVLHFDQPTCISLTGARVDAFVNNVKVRTDCRISVYSNDILSFNICEKNVYGYVGIYNGFCTDLVLGSRSFYEGVTDHNRLVKDDFLEYKSDNNFQPHMASVRVNIEDESIDGISVFEGPEFGLLTSSQKDKLLNEYFVVSSARNRMAIQLDGVFNNDLPTILTSPVLPGTVQLTPSGNIIVLMRDAQTTGGYPRILQLTASSIDKIAQKRTGDKLKFMTVKL